MSPEELMDEIYNLNSLEYFALTDHDTLSGIEPMFRLKKLYETGRDYQGKNFIPGIALSLRDQDTGLSVHLIGLFPHIDEGNLSEGLGESEADEPAREMQGVLAKFERTPIEESGTLEGLSLLKKTGAITIFAHPAVDHFRVGYNDFDQKILYPMISLFFCSYFPLQN